MIGSGISSSSSNISLQILPTFLSAAQPFPEFRFHIHHPLKSSRWPPPTWGPGPNTDYLPSEQVPLVSPLELNFSHHLALSPAYPTCLSSPFVRCLCFSILSVTSVVQVPTNSLQNQYNKLLIGFFTSFLFLLIHPILSWDIRNDFYMV